MKRFGIMMLLIGLFSVLNVYAQKNPHAGYVITNQGDTIHGMIDFFSDERCARECKFCVSGDTKYVTYSPTEIQGYRLESGGVYYVSRTFPVDGIEKTLFAEFLLQGGVSLYRHIEGSREYFYLVDEEGNVEELCHLPAVSFGEEESQKAYKKAYLSAVRIFKKSPYTIKLFGQTRMERDKLTQLVRAYDEEYCPESGNCVQYSYEAKKTIGVKPHFVVEAGYDFGEVRVGGYTFKGNMPQFSAGCEFEFPRLSKNFYAHALLFYSPWEVKAKNHSKDIKVKFKYGGLMLGGGYKLTKWGFVQPFVNAGIRFAHYSNLKGAHVGSYLTSDQSDSGYNVDLYGGAGLRVPIKKIQLMVTMNYSGSIMKERDKTTVSGLTLKASVVY